jgi:hypothetical protein
MRPGGGSGMASDYKIHRLAQLKRALQILRETIDRRYPPDEAVEHKLQDCELESTLLEIELKKER